MCTATTDKQDPQWECTSTYAKAFPIMHVELSGGAPFELAGEEYVDCISDTSECLPPVRANAAPLEIPPLQKLHVVRPPTGSHD